MTQMVDTQIIVRPEQNCSSISEYAQRISAWQDRFDNPAPVLDARAIIPKQFDNEALFQQAFADDFTSTTSAVLGLRRDPLCVFAAAHAAFAGKRLHLMEELEELGTITPDIGAARSVTLVLSARNCALFGADQIAGLFRDAGISNWGLLSGLGAAETSRLIARIATRTPADRLTGTLYCGFQTSKRTPRLKGLMTSDVLETPMPLDISGPPQAFSYFRGHGRSHCGLDGNVCTKPTPSAPGDTSCIGEYECMFPKYRRIPAAELAVDFCVLDVCAPVSFRPRGPHKTEGFNLGLHLQAGTATSVLAPYRYHSSAGFSPHLAWHLARTGATAGDIQQALNTYFRDRFDQHPPYILLGDPDMQIAQPDNAMPAGFHMLGAGIEVDVVPGSTCFYPLELTTTQVQGLCPQDNEPWPRSLVEQMTLDGTKGLLIAWDSDEQARTFILDQKAALASDHLDRAGLKDWIAHAQHLPLPERKRPDSLKQALTTAQQFESFFTNTQTCALLDSGQHRLERDVLQTLTALLDAAAKDILVILLEGAARNDAWLPTNLSQNTGMIWVGSDMRGDICPYCDGQLLSRSYQAGFFDPAVRTVKECEHHLLVSDRPADPLVDLRLDLNEAVALGALNDLIIRGQNGADHPVHLAVVVSIVRQEVDSSDIIISPDVQSIVVEPGKAFDLRFAMTLGHSAWAIGHNVQAIVLCNGAAISLYRQVQFTRVPPHA